MTFSPKSKGDLNLFDVLSQCVVCDYSVLLKLLFNLVDVIYTVLISLTIVAIDMILHTIITKLHDMYTSYGLHPVYKVASDATVIAYP